MVSCSMGERGEQAAVKEEAAQIEAASLDGREAAREFVSREWKDTFELQQRLAEASSRRGAYDSLPQSRAAFDSTFISTIRTVRPDVARELEKVRNRNN